jgi:hypothetical protein
MSENLRKPASGDEGLDEPCGRAREHNEANDFLSPSRHRIRHHSPKLVVKVTFPLGNKARLRSNGIKETLNARSEYENDQVDGKARHRVNQYVIKDEIGRGSFGAVHIGVDEFGKEYVSIFTSDCNIILIALE